MDGFVEWVSPFASTSRVNSIRKVAFRTAAPVPSNLLLPAVVELLETFKVLFPFGNVLDNIDSLTPDRITVLEEIVPGNIVQIMEIVHAAADTVRGLLIDFPSLAKKEFVQIEHNLVICLAKGGEGLFIG